MDTTTTTATDTMLTVQQAARYLQLPAGYIRRQIKYANGPKFYGPSPRTKFFRRADLDAWRETWQTKE